MPTGRIRPALWCRRISELFRQWLHEGLCRDQAPLDTFCHFTIEETEEKMRVHYDADVDAIYIKLGNQKPDGVIEISDGVNLDTTSENKIVGIEILNSSKKMNIKTILSYELELDKKLIKKTA